jgi:3-oxoacyl-[acyl-carrier-protein] synthase I
MNFEKTSPVSPRLITPIAVRAMTATQSFGAGLAVFSEGLRSNRHALVHGGFEGLTLDTWIGRVPGIESHVLSGPSPAFDARNHRIMDLALQQDGFEDAINRLKARFGSHRIGVIVGTSTSGILETEKAYRRRDPETGALPRDFRYRERQNTAAPAAFLSQRLGLSGPSWVISTACSSSSKVFASAARLLEANWCDAVVVGGADSLCLTTLYGFHALGLVSSTPGRPMDQSRDGISIGEGAGFMLLTRAEADEPGTRLLGYGESADAHHMSTPHPEGEGAYRAMQAALARSGLSPAAIDFTLLHGTGTPANDQAEDIALTRFLGPDAPAASIKGAIGHTLGAAGILNAVAACLALQEGWLPGTCNLEVQDSKFQTRVLPTSEERSARTILTNAFGFGGSNAALIFGHRP